MCHYYVSEVILYREESIFFLRKTYFMTSFLCIFMQNKALIQRLRPFAGRKKDIMPTEKKLDNERTSEKMYSYGTLRDWIGVSHGVVQP